MMESYSYTDNVPEGVGGDSESAGLEGGDEIAKGFEGISEGGPADFAKVMETGVPEMRELSPNPLDNFSNGEGDAAIEMTEGNGQVDALADVTEKGEQERKKYEFSDWVDLDHAAENDVTVNVITDLLTELQGVVDADTPMGNDVLSAVDRKYREVARVAEERALERNREIIEEKIPEWIEAGSALFEDPQMKERWKDRVEHCRSMPYSGPLVEKALFCMQDLADGVEFAEIDKKRGYDLERASDSLETDGIIRRFMGQQGEDYAKHSDSLRAMFE